MTYKETEQKVLKEGFYVTDDSFIASETWQGLRCSARIRIILYEGKTYYHKMLDGITVSFIQIGA